MSRTPEKPDTERIHPATGEPVTDRPRSTRWNGMERRGPDRRLRERRIPLPERSIEVRITSFERGLEILPGVQVIRINSSKYNLLIMVDYTSLLGEMDGSIEIVTAGDRIFLENTQGFYCLRDNVFELMIKESGNERLG